MGHYTNSHEFPNYSPKKTNHKSGNKDSLTSGTQNKEGINVLIFTFYQSGCRVPKSWILLDSQSTVDVFCNPELMESIWLVPEAMKIWCNAGICTTNFIGDLPGYGTVWLNHEAIAIILSLKLVQEKYHIAYDHEQDGGFVVTKQNGENLILYSPNKASIIWTLHFQVHVNQMKRMFLQ